MFVREKRIGAYSYLYFVETVRENGKTKQRIVRNLGRKEMVEAHGDLDRLVPNFDTIILKAVRFQ
jgi:hypothetical protein